MSDARRLAASLPTGVGVLVGALDAAHERHLVPPRYRGGEREQREQAGVSPDHLAARERRWRAAVGAIAPVQQHGH